MLQAPEAILRAEWNYKSAVEIRVWWCVAVFNLQVSGLLIDATSLPLHPVMEIRRMPTPL